MKSAKRRHLADHELAVGLGLGDGLVDLFEGIDRFVVHFFQFSSLCLRQDGHDQGEQGDHQVFFHRSVDLT